MDDPVMMRGAGTGHASLTRPTRGALAGLGAVTRAVLRNPVLPLLVIAIPAFALFVPGYATPQNVSNLALSSAVLLLLVGGGAFVLISGNFDLSTEGTLAFTAVVGGWLMTTQAPGSGWGLAPSLTIIVMIAIGVLIGVVNGLLVELLQVNPFIVTLGMLLTLKGAAAIPTQAQTIYGLPPGFNWVGRASFLGISVVVVVAVVVYTILGLYLKYAQFGRHLYAIGGNKEAARENGISAVKVVVAAYAISGGLAGLAAWLDAARLDSTGPVLGDGIIFVVFAALVIGGVSLTGGRGSLLSAAGGVVLLGSIDNVLNLIALSPFYVNFVRGAVILVSVVLIVLRQRLAMRLRLQEPAA